MPISRPRFSSPAETPKAIRGTARDERPPRRERPYPTELPLPAARPAAAYPPWLAVRTERGAISVLATAQLEILEAAGKCVEVHTAEAKFLVRGPLLDLERILDPQQFLRVNRSTIVAIGKIREIHASLGRFSVILASGRRVVSGPTFHSGLRDFVANRPRQI